MEFNPSLAVRLLLVFLTIIVLLWQCLIVTGCVPKQGGADSALSSLHLMELTTGSKSVRFGYLAYCTSVTGDDNKTVNVCNGVDSLIDPSADKISSKLPNLDPNLFKVAFNLNRSAFPQLPVVTVITLGVCIALQFAQCFIKKQNIAVSRLLSLNIFALLGCSTVLALVSATNLTMISSTISNESVVTTDKYTATRGQVAFVLHWLIFGQLTFVSLLSIFVLRFSGKQSKPEPKLKSRPSRSRSTRARGTPDSTTRLVTPNVDSLDDESIYSTDETTRYIPEYGADNEKRYRTSSIMPYYHYNPNCYDNINHGRFDPDSYSIYTSRRVSANNFDQLTINNNTITHTKLADIEEKPLPTPEPELSTIGELDGRQTTPLDPADIQTRYLGPMLPAYNPQSRPTRSSSQNVTRLSSKYSKGSLKRGGTNTSQNHKARSAAYKERSQQQQDRYYKDAVYDVDLRLSTAG